MNPCDPYDWNTVAMIKQLTLVIYADDVLMACILSKAVTNYAKKLDESCSQNDPLTVTRGKMYELLGMTAAFRTEG